MEENNELKQLTKEQQTQTIDKSIIHRPSLFSQTYFQNKAVHLPIPPNDIKNNTNDNFDKNLSLLNLLTNKSHFIEPNKDFQIMPELPKNGKACSLTSKNNLNKIKKVNFNISQNPYKKPFYITSSFVPISQKPTMRNYSSFQNLNVNNKNFIIDLIHEKEIQLCLDLIKSFPQSNKNKRLNIKKDFKNKETSNLIRLIKTFNIDNINNQRLIEKQILDKFNYSSELNPLNTLSVSMSTNYRTNNLPVNNVYKFNLSNISNKNLNSSSITLKNNSSFNKNLDDSNILNNNSSINEKLTKSKIIKSIHNRINHNNIYDPKNEINFHTGFVRSQKNVYEDVYSKYFKNRKKDAIRVKRFRKKKQDANKLSLPEIEEYKTIIKEIETRKNKGLRKSQSAADINKDKNEVVLKDQLMEELNNVYLKQKNSFLNSLKDNFGDSEKLQIETYKNEINENIKNINKNKRCPNVFVDGYSMFDGDINKKIKEYNYVLGNRFYDKNQKMEKTKKFFKLANEFDNKIKMYQNELLNEKLKYKNVFKPKIDFNKDKKIMEDEVKIDMSRYKINKLKGIISMGLNNNIEKKGFKNLSRNNIKDDKVYNDYKQFKSEYRKKYSLD